MLPLSEIRDVVNMCLFTQLKCDYDMQTIIRQIVNNILVTTTNCRKDDLWYLCSMNALYFKKLSKICFYAHFSGNMTASYLTLHHFPRDVSNRLEDLYMSSNMTLSN